MIMHLLKFIQFLYNANPIASIFNYFSLHVHWMTCDKVVMVTARSNVGISDPHTYQLNNHIMLLCVHNNDCTCPLRSLTFKSRFFIRASSALLSASPCFSLSCKNAILSMYCNESHVWPIYEQMVRIKTLPHHFVLLTHLFQL